MLREYQYAELQMKLTLWKKHRFALMRIGAAFIKMIVGDQMRATPLSRAACATAAATAFPTRGSKAAGMI